MFTPWGRAQTQEHGAEGIVLVTTAGHGGFWISDERRAAMPEPFKSIRTFAGGNWYEEDCDSAIVMLAFPEAFADPTRFGWLPEMTAERLQSLAEDTFRDNWPDEWEAWRGRNLQPGESRKRDERNYYAEHSQDLLVISAFGSWADWVPEGKVGVYAVVGGRGPDGNDANGKQRHRFLIPDDEYQIEPGKPFVCDPSRHQEVPL